MNIIIRKATYADAEVTAKIARDEWAGIYDGYRALLGDDIYDSLYQSPLDKKSDSIKNFILTGGNAYVAEADGVVCAFATYSINGNIGTLSNNAVSADFRGNGIASMLYNHIFEEMKSVGIDTVCVSTGLDDAHASARRAYEKMGFKVGLPKITYYKKLR